MLLLHSLYVLGNFFISTSNDCLFFVLHDLHLVHTILVLFCSLYLIFIAYSFLFKHLHIYNSDKLSTRLDSESFKNLMLSINFKL